MKSYFIISVFVLLAAMSSLSISSEGDTSNENNIVLADSTAKCPVTGDDISSEHVSFRYVDKELKFCNDGCLMAYKKDPSKYSEHLKCMPCNDDDANREISTTHDGVKYYFCGKGCKGKFEKDPESYLKQFSKQN